MISNNSFLYTIQILLEVLRDFIYFPVWWYSAGLFRFFKLLLGLISLTEKNLALFVWIKNIFTPMFGQSDWQGRLISVFIRVVQIITRTIILAVVIVFAVILFLVWICFPILVIYQIFFQILNF